MEPERKTDEEADQASLKRKKPYEKPHAEALTHDDYTVGWVCALPKEQTAATTMLDKCHPNLPTLPNDPNTYTLGSIGQHNVVVTCLPKGMIGTVSAAQVATRMVSSFPSIKFGLMVGIGGGVPSNKVRLGDIVVSTSDGAFPGVVQWDFGKADGSGEIQRIGSLNNPPKLLLTALTKLETQHDLGRSKMTDYLEELKSKFPRLASRYLQSDSLEDTLFRADYHHVSKRPPDAGHEGDEEDEEEVESCQFCDKTKTLKRKPREMQVHYGLIASGNQVIKDAAFRDRINSNLGGNVRCFEMEAAGLMNNFPCLVVRGICDYADSHKNKDWQEHAAIMAAAFTKDLLQYVQPSDIERERPVKDMLEDVHNNTAVIRQDVDQMKLQQDKKEDILILDWLTKVDYGPKQSDHFKQRQPGTGCWLLETEAFKSWLVTPGRTLFCPGIPGAGKTVLTSLVVNHLISNFRGDLSTGIVYIYCSSKQQHEQNSDQLLTSMLKQLASSQPILSTSIKALYDEHSRQRTRPELNTILEELQQMVATYSRVFILVDALDECEASECSRSNLLSELGSLQKQYQINVFATSRPIPIIKSEVTSHFGTVTSLEILANKKDITQYLKGHMEKLPSFVRQDPNLEENIISVISESVDGMFLLARIYFYLLSDKLRDADIREQLRIFQRRGTSQDGLRHAYRETMDRINGQMLGWKLLAHKVLSWIVHAKRDLTVTELRHALATSTEKFQLDDADFYHVDDMVAACAGLVTVDETSNIIRLIHYTTQEYFNRWPEKLHLMTEKDIAKTCVSYLSFDSFRRGRCRTMESFEKRLHIHPFYDYAAKNWGHHARASTVSYLDLASFFSKERNMDASVQMFLVTDPAQVEFTYRVRGEPTKLHLAAYFGLARVVQDMLENGLEMDPRDSEGLTPLCYAAIHGHEPVILLLLDNGAKVDTFDYDGRTPLSFAANYGHRNVTQLLIDKGADVDSQCTAPYHKGWTPLYFAIDGKHRDVAQLLLERGAGRNCSDERLLPFVVRRGHETIVRLLLERGANTESESTAFGYAAKSPLSIAAHLGYEAIFRLLLKYGAAVDANCTTYGRTPLSFAAAHGHGIFVQLLIERGAEPDRKAHRFTLSSLLSKYGHEIVVQLQIDREDEPDTTAHGYETDGRTPLSLASEHGHGAIVDFLLKTGRADPKSKDKHGRTPLTFAAIGGHADVVQLLLETYNVDVDSMDDEGGTPLSHAALGGFEIVCSLLIEAGAKPDLPVSVKRERNRRTPLSLAAQYGHKAVAQLLLGKGANPNSKTTDMVSEISGRTPLSFAAENGHEDTVRLLVEKGADVNHRITSYFAQGTPLSFATRHSAIVKLLLEKGANPEPMNDEADNLRKPILAAAWYHNEVAVNLLLDTGRVRVDEGDSRGRTPLSYMAEGGSEATICRLLESGAHLESQDAWGRTPLSYAAGNGNEAVVRFFIKKEANVESKTIHVDLQFRRQCSGRTSLSFAAEDGYEAVIRLLVEMGGARPDSVDADGRTPLSYAAQEGHKAVVRLLADMYGARPDSIDVKGRTPLSYAAKRGHEAVVRLLADMYGARPDSIDVKGRTPLSHAAEEGREDVVEYLLEQGVNVESKSTEGETPLSFSAQGSSLGCVGVMELLLEKGADVNVKDAWGQTPLFSTTFRWQSEELARILLETGADVDAKDLEARTPLSSAVRNGCTTVVKLLLEKKADPYSEDTAGRTPRSLAFETHQQNIVELFRDK